MQPLPQVVSCTTSDLQTRAVRAMSTTRVSALVTSRPFATRQARCPSRYGRSGIGRSAAETATSVSVARQLKSRAPSRSAQAPRACRQMRTVSARNFLRLSTAPPPPGVSVPHYQRLRRWKSRWSRAPFAAPKPAVLHHCRCYLGGNGERFSANANGAWTTCRTFRPSAAVAGVYRNDGSALRTASANR